MPEYFQLLVGNTVVLGMMGFVVIIIQFFMFLLGGFVADQQEGKKLLC